jgi:hypothetical protein
MPSLLQFAFTAYAPLVLSREIIAPGKQRYAIAQADNRLDLRWLQTALTRFEPAWEIVAKFHQLRQVILTQLRQAILTKFGT